MEKWNILKDYLTVDSALIKELEDTKKNLDQINYANLYSGYQKGELFLPNYEAGKKVQLSPLQSIDNDSNVKSAFNSIQNKLDNKTRVGLVSNGVHSIDLISTYFTKEIIKDIQKCVPWSKKRVMFIYEAPSCNLDNTYGYLNSGCNDVPTYLNILKNHRNQTASPVILRDMLTANWWRLDNVKENTSPASGFPDWYSTKWSKNISAQKEYETLLLSMMVIFGLLNVYQTNLFRFELYDSEATTNRAREKALGWDEMMSINNGNLIDIAYAEVFYKEYAAFKPDIILATSKPYAYLKKKLNNTGIYKIPHPTSRLTDSQRLCLNICQIAKSLYKEKIISYNTVMTIINEYIELPEQE